MKHYDSLILDMDGTMWDAVDSYVKVWADASRQLGVNLYPTRDDLLLYMGKPIDVIFSSLAPDASIDRDQYLEELDRQENTMMPIYGGRLYPGVADGIEQLAGRYRLFMVSNCGSEGLRNMLQYAGLSKFFEGTLTHGETGHGKDYNIARVIETFSLERPLYIGDTQGDCDAAHAAGIDMCHARWGFGSCHDAEMGFDSFPEMTAYLMK